MKKSNIKKLALLCGVLALSSELGYSAEAGDIPALQEGVQRVQREVRADVQRYADALGSVIVIGKTGGGKSSLITSLAQPLVVQASGGGLKLVADNPLLGINIGRGMGAGTRSPAAWYDQPRRTVYWDCPGFDGPNAAMQEIINSFSIHQLFANPSNVKVVIAIQEADVQDRAIPFLEMLEKMTEVFPNNDKLTPCLSLIITKQGRTTPLTVLEEAFDTATAHNLNNPNNQIDALKKPRVKELFQFLSENAEQRVSFLPYPNAAGAYGNGNRDGILRVIGNTSYMVNPDVNLVIGKTQRELVSSLGQGLITGIQTRLSTNVSTTLENTCEGLVNNRAPTTIAAQLKARFAETYSLLNVVRVDSATNFLTDMTAVLQPLGIEGELQDVHTKVSCLDFCHRINGAINYQLNSWGTSLGTVKTRLHVLSEAPVQVKEENHNDGVYKVTTTTFSAKANSQTWPATGKVVVEEARLRDLPPPPAPVAVAPAPRRHRTTEEKIVKAVVTKPLKQANNLLKKLF
jgi:hypothetical protein